VRFFHKPAAHPSPNPAYAASTVFLVTDNHHNRRKRIVWRATHRGIREMDFVVGTFVKSRVEAADEAELAELERILDIPDQDLMAWMTGALPVPSDQNSGLLQEMLATRFDETFFGEIK
jgi:antitoxin CptB